MKPYKINPFHTKISFIFSRDIDCQTVNQLRPSQIGINSLGFANSTLELRKLPIEKLIISLKKNNQWLKFAAAFESWDGDFIRFQISAEDRPAFRRHFLSSYVMQKDCVF